MTVASFLTKLETGFAKDEAWLIAEVAKGRALLTEIEQTVDVDIQGIFTWIQTHQAGILDIFHQALSGMAVAGALIPAAGPEIAIAVSAINAATAGVNVLAKAVVAGSTPLSTAVNAYHAVKDAQTAVNAVLKNATALPTTLPAPAATPAPAPAA